MLEYVLLKDEFENNYLYLKCNKLDIDNINDQLLKFTVSTYENFKTIDTIKNNAVLKPVNEFFKTLDLKDQAGIAKILICMNFWIQKTFDHEEVVTDNFQTKLDEVVLKIQDFLIILDSEINLFQKIYNFVVESIYIHKAKDLGTRPQDSEEMTFHNEQIEVLTGVVVLCKLLVPIFGQIIDRIKKHIDNSLKEIHCARILTPILKKHIFDLVIKLKNYLYKTINPKLTIDQAYHMYTENFCILTVQAILFVRRFVSIDIYNPDSKLMVYINFCARSASNTQQTNATKRLSVRERSHPSEIFGDDGNTSVLECDSQYSKTTIDIPIFIKHKTVSFIEQSILEYGIDKNILDLMVQDYIYNSFMMTDINKYLLCIAFGKQLNGAKSIAYLNQREYITLSSFLQLKFLYTSFFNLIPLLSLKISYNEKRQITSNENLIRINWDKSMEYRLCKDKYPISVGFKSWDTKLKEIINILTVSTCYQYFPPVFLESMNEPFENNVKYELSLDIINLFCKFIYEAI